MQSLATAFPNVRFDVPTVREGIDLFRETVRRENPAMVTVTTDIESGKEDLTDRYDATSMSIKQGHSTRTFDHVEEFFGEMRKPYDQASFRVQFPMYLEGPSSMSFQEMWDRTTIEIVHPVRGGIDRIMGHFLDEAPRFTVEPLPEPAAPRPRVFIGHGGSSTAWRDLKDHLAEQHGYDVEAYETGTRSGHTIRDILDDMLNASTFAILVMTAEDEQTDTSMRARQNVVHEAGLFQGRLGFTKTLILLEEGTQSFTNLDGIQYVGFGSGRIREAYGDVLAVLAREFPTT